MLKMIFSFIQTYQMKWANVLQISVANVALYLLINRHYNSNIIWLSNILKNKKNKTFLLHLK